MIIFLCFNHYDIAGKRSTVSGFDNFDILYKKLDDSAQFVLFVRKFQ